MAAAVTNKTQDMTNIMADRMTDTYGARISGVAIREGFDFSNMSDVDYTNTFSDMDQNAEEMAEFERSLVPGVCYYFAADRVMSSSIRRSGDRFGHRIRFDKTDDMFRVSVAVRGFTGVVLDLDKIPANIREYSVVPDNPGGLDDDGHLCVYAMPRADGTLVGSPSYVDGSYMIVPARPLTKPVYVFWYNPYGPGPDSGYRPLRSFEGAPRECDNFGVARIYRQTAAGTSAWRTDVSDLTGSPDVVYGSADFSDCDSLTSAKGAPRRIGKDLVLYSTRVVPWDDNGRCVPMFGDGVAREIGGRIKLMSPDVLKDRSRGGQRGGQPTMETVDIGRPGSGKYNGLADLIADNCSCGEDVRVMMESDRIGTVLRAVTAANTVADYPRR